MSTASPDRSAQPLASTAPSRGGPEGTVHDWLVADLLAPDVTGSLAPLFAAANRGSLVMPFCRSCAAALELEQEVCDACAAGEVVWRPVEPIGTVHSATTVHRIEGRLLHFGAPYPVIDVELRSGHRVVMTTDRPADAPAIGDRVAVGFRRVGGVAVPAVASHPSEEAGVGADGAGPEGGEEETP